jgi:hypothetical protein
MCRASARERDHCSGQPLGSHVWQKETPKKHAAETVLFRRGDGLVRLADVESEFWLNGAEVEAYECR